MGCGAPVQGGAVAVAAGQTLIQGVVTAAGDPVESAYVRLLDASGEFTAEVVSSAGGEFRFFAAPGSWTVRALSARGTGQLTLSADPGLNSVTLPLGEQPAAAAG